MVKLLGRAVYPSAVLNAVNSILEVEIRPRRLVVGLPMH